MKNYKETESSLGGWSSYLYGWNGMIPGLVMGRSPHHPRMGPGDTCKVCRKSRVRNQKTLRFLKKFPSRPLLFFSNGMQRGNQQFIENVLAFW